MSECEDPGLPALLTEDEHSLVYDLGQIWNRLCAITAPGPTRAADLGELVVHVHALQNLVMAQAAARAYPDMYRLLGSTVTAAALPEWRET